MLVTCRRILTSLLQRHHLLMCWFSTIQSTLLNQVKVKSLLDHFCLIPNNCFKVIQTSLDYNFSRFKNCFVGPVMTLDFNDLTEGPHSRLYSWQQTIYRAKAEGRYRSVIVQRDQAYRLLSPSLLWPQRACILSSSQPQGHVLMSLPREAPWSLRVWSFYGDLVT